MIDAPAELNVDQRKELGLYGICIENRF